MSKNSPSARRHRILKFLKQVQMYRDYGPLIGPKEKHQPNPRWEKMDEVSRLRQIKCARSREGHSLSNGEYGTCTKCGLSVDPPAEKK